MLTRSYPSVASHDGKWFISRRIEETNRNLNPLGKYTSEYLHSDLVWRMSTYPTETSYFSTKEAAQSVVDKWDAQQGGDNES